MQTGCQIYVKGSEEAVRMYQAAVGWTKGMCFQRPNGTYEHVSLMSGEREMLAVAEDADGICSPETVGGKAPVMSFNCYDLGTREAVDLAYSVLSEGARFTENPGGPGPLPWNDYCFYLVDRYGVYWWVAV